MSIPRIFPTLSEILRLPGFEVVTERQKLVDLGDDGLLFRERGQRDVERLGGGEIDRLMYRPFRESMKRLSLTDEEVH